MLTSECQMIMDLTKRKKVSSRADSLVTKSQNGIGKIDAAIALEKEKASQYIIRLQTL